MVSNIQNMENLNPQVMRILGKEMQSLKVEPLEGISVILDDQDITQVEAIVDGPADTPYFGGKFRVKLAIGKDFPQGPPKGFFLTKIFHPNVSSKGEICVNTLKRDWKSDLGLRHVLLTIKCLLIVPNPESALNEEAGKLLLEHYDDYCARAKLYTDIHAKPSESSSSSAKTAPNSSVASSNLQTNSELSSSENSEHSANKKACNGVNGHENTTVKKAISKKDKIIKDKKKTLKRL